MLKVAASALRFIRARWRWARGRCPRCDRNLFAPFPYGGATCRCLSLPINGEEVAQILAHTRAGNPPGRHMLDFEMAQALDRWRDDGGRG